MRISLFRKNLITKALIGGFIIASVFSFVYYDSNCKNLEDKVLRLHVKANSDSAEDQQIKLAVKDKVFTFVSDISEDCNSITSAEGVITANLDLISSVANEYLDYIGADYRAKVYIDNSFFGTRDYGNFALPAGRYKALRVDLGRAEGENWWCAVYPSLCISSSAKFDDFSDNEVKIITKESSAYEIRFKFYEIYRRLADALSK